MEAHLEPPISDQPELSRRYRIRALVLMASMTVLMVMDRQLLAVLIEPIKRDLGVSDAAMGALAGTSFALFHSVATIPLARWADRGTRRTIIAWGLAVWSILTVLTGLARGFAGIFVVRMGVGIGEAAGAAPAHSLLSDYFPQERRATALSVLVMGGPLGAMVALAGGGWLSDTFGWRVAFFVFGAPGILLALLIHATLPEPRRGATETAAVDTTTLSFWASLRFLWRIRTFRHLVLGSALNSAGLYAILIWSVPYLMRVHEQSAAEAGLRVAIANALFAALGSLVAGPVSDRLGIRDIRWLCWLPVLTSTAVVPFAWGFALAPEANLALLFLIPASFVGGSFFGPLYSAMQALAPLRMRALAPACTTMMNNALGLGLAPPLVGWMTDRWTPEYGPDAIRYSLCLILVVHLWAAAHLLLASRALRGDLQVKQRIEA